MTSILVRPSSTDMLNTKLAELCKRRTDALVDQHRLRTLELSQSELVDRLVQIVSRNVDSGRALRVITRNRYSKESITTKQLERYIDIVIKFYLIEFRRLERLAARDEDEWAQLLDRLIYRARNILHGFHTSSDPADFAVQACESIFMQWFPFDVYFDAWSTTILRNHILWPPTRSHDLIDRNPIVYSLDQMNSVDTKSERSLYEVLPDQTVSADFERSEVRQEILEAIDLLPSEEQKAVIIYKFFDDLSNEEIARKLNKTRQAIYSLRHRALRGLDVILHGEDTQERSST